MAAATDGGFDVTVGGRGRVTVGMRYGDAVRGGVGCFTPQAINRCFNGGIGMDIYHIIQLFEDEGRLLQETRPRTFIHFRVNLTRFMVKIHLP